MDERSRTAPAEMQERTQSAMIYDPVPRFPDQIRLDTPTPTQDRPAVLSYIIRTRETAPDGTGSDTMYFYIGRDRTVPLKSFTISYRFSALPVMVDDPEHPFYTYEYADDDIDAHEYLLCRFTLPPQMAEHFPGCAAFVSSIVFAAQEGGEDRVLTFSSGDFVYSAEDAARVQAAMNAAYGEETFSPAGVAGAAADGNLHDAHTAVYRPYPAEEDAEDALEATRLVQEKQRKKRRRWIRVIGYALLAAGGLTLVSAGMSYLSYQRAMIGAEVYLDAGQYTAAENYINETVGTNIFLNSQRSALSRTILRLCSEGRYNEAYRIAAGTPFASVLQNVCREASEVALAAGDWEEAYVYALGAPEPFEDEITDAAAAVVLDPYTSVLDEDAYRVAQKTADSAVLDDLLLAVVRWATGDNRYHVAMRAAQSITDSAVCADTVADIFGIATRYYISKNNFDAAADFIAAYRTDENSIDPEVEDALIRYFSESRDADSAFFLAKQFGIDASHIPIDAEDPAIRADLSGLYPLLTAEQKRSYHAGTVTAGGLLLTVNQSGAVRLSVSPSGVKPAGGADTSMADAQRRIDNALAGKPAVVSVASGDLMTALLHKDGTVTMLSNRIVGNPAVAALTEELRLITAAQALTDVVAVETGGSHFVFLRADGSVACFGDNSAGQCGTTTSAWRDIAGIAAGASFTVGMRSDGTVVACGSDSAGQCDVDDLRNVVDVEACDRTTVVLFADGSIGLRGERSMGIADALQLENITRIRAGGSAVIAELRDGTYTLCGGCAETGNYGSTASWHNLTDYDVGAVCAAAVEEDGGIRTTGTNRAKQ